MLTAAAGAAPAPAPARDKPTARELIERLRQRAGVALPTPTVDTFKAGDPDTRVQGIATTFMATLAVLQRAAASGKNLVITHEPTFYNHRDETEALTSDPVFAFKRDFIAANRMVVYRYHDQLHRHQPDVILDGMENAFSWRRFADAKPAIDQRSYALPSTTLGDLARHVQASLAIRALRVVGDPKLPVRRVGLNAGYTSLEEVQALLERNDVVIAGELREWEGVEYTQDAVAAGMKKGLILLGHQISEEPGMKLCAEWLASFIPEVPVVWIPGGEPFWRA